MTIHALAGKPAPQEMLVDIDQLRKDCYARKSEHLRRIQQEAQELLASTMAGVG